MFRGKPDLKLANAAGVIEDGHHGLTIAIGWISGVVGKIVSHS